MGRQAVKYLLDTSVWINRTLIPEVIPPRIRNLLRDEVCGVCSISYLETAILHRLGRLPLAGSLEDFSPWPTDKTLRR